jgi:aminopeptidase N
MEIVVVPRTSGSDYQRAGYILLSHRSYPAPITPVEDEIKRAHHVAHELAHAWWSAGNPVTEDDWLNESFADYSGLRYVESVFGVAARRSVLDEARADAEKAGPVIGAGRPSQQALYSKGPILLFDLDARIGRAKMDQLMARIGRDRPHRTAQFLDALAAVAGQSAADDFARRLRATDLILG